MLATSINQDTNEGGPIMRRVPLSITFRPEEVKTIDNLRQTDQLTRSEIIRILLRKNTKLKNVLDGYRQKNKTS